MNNELLARQYDRNADALEKLLDRARTTGRANGYSVADIEAAIRDYRALAREYGVKAS